MFDASISILAYKPSSFFLYMMSGDVWSFVERKNSPSNAKEIKCVSFVIGLTVG